MPDDAGASNAREHRPQCVCALDAAHRALHDAARTQPSVSQRATKM
jgi:hypothetical protein